MKRVCFVILLLLSFGVLVFFIDRYYKWHQVNSRLKEIELEVVRIRDQIRPAVVDPANLLASYPGVTELRNRESALEAHMIVAMYLLFISGAATVAVFNLGRKRRPVVVEY